VLGAWELQERLGLPMPESGTRQCKREVKLESQATLAPHFSLSLLLGWPNSGLAAHWVCGYPAQPPPFQLSLGAPWARLIL
jgi:hypothetical protein